MSNSIWKTGDPTYNSDRSGDDIIMEYHRADGSKFYIVGDCSELNDRWAYLTDIIAQADKAERLQKAVDYALQVLDNVSEIGGIDLEIIKIKQLIKERKC